MGDFNGDGKLDLAVANYLSGTVSILLGDGTGKFTLASSPSVVDPGPVVVGDFNGDGKLDLAVASNGNDTVSVLLGDGTGNFTQASSPATGSRPYVIAPEDFNGDGNLDLAVVNNGDTAVSILLGDGKGNFSLADFPGTGLTPTVGAVGDFNGDGKLDLAVATGNNTISILLQVTPYPPAVTLYNANLNFGTVLVGASSSSQIVTIDNTGGSTLEITSIAASANFTQTNTCGSSLVAGASCYITVTFRPHHVGTLTGTITITDNASNSPQTASLTGIGTAVTLSPTSLNFGNQSVGTTSAPQTVTMTNHGHRTLTVGVRLRGSDPGDFAQTNTCGNSLAAGASCTISVTFTPQAKGSRTATLDVIDNGGGSPQTVGLKGDGT